MTTLGVGLGGALGTLGSPVTANITFQGVAYADIAELVTFLPDASGQRAFYDSFSDTGRFLAYLAAAQGYTVTLSDTVNLTAAETATYSVLLADVIRVVLEQQPSTLYGETLVDTARISELLQRTFPAALADTITLDRAVTAVAGATILEQLNIAPQLLPSGIYSQSAADTLRFADSLARFLDGTIADSLSIVAALDTRARLAGVLSETMTITETAAPMLLLNVTASEAIEITAAEALQVLYTETILEGVEITAGYLSPGGDFTTWVMNTRTTAVTEYENFDFNSFAVMGAKYIGASSSGLYELNGDTDDGTDIIAKIRGGYMQFGGTKLSRLKAAYIAMRGEGDYVLKIETGDGASYSYAVSTRNMRSTKVHMGKGQRARYFAFELIGTGSDFDLDTLEFVPVVMRRRV